MIKKCLKGLCILGLTLLPISFSSADFLDVSCQTFNNQSTMVVYDNTILTFRNGNFTTNRLNNSIEHVMWLTNKNFVSNPSNNNSNTSSFFAWYNGNPYIFAGTLGDDFQGFPQNVCVESLSGFNITSYGASMNCTSESINSFLLAGNINGGAICYPSTTNTYAYGLFTYCFYDDNNAYCFKITSYRNSPNLQVLTLSGSLNLPSRVNVSNLQAINWSKSPFNGSSVPNYSYNTGKVITNSDALMGFEYMGLSQEYCYGGFSLDDTFLPTETFEDFQGYSFGNGATIFQLYNAYSGGSTVYGFMSRYYQSLLNSQLSNFHNKSKGLLMLVQQYQSSNERGWGSYTLKDLVDYCDLLFNLIDNNWANDGDPYTGGNKNAINSYNTNNIINSNNGGFYLTGYLGTGQYSGFSAPDEFFGRINSLFQSSIDVVNGTFPPIIPSYIVAFMLAIILIRIISH